MNTFITARDSHVVIYSGDDIVIQANNAADLALEISKNDIDVINASTSSTMDFADEEGFANYDDARNMVADALKIIQDAKEKVDAEMANLDAKVDGIVDSLTGLNYIELSMVIDRLFTADQKRAEWISRDVEWRSMDKAIVEGGLDNA